MPSFADLLQQGAGNAWLFIPSAVVLGALHGLEPGHSKTMMAAFIVAIRGTVGQAVLLGLAATASHTAVVWAVALVGLYLGSHWNPETSEPYFQLASAVLIVGVALWMLVRTWRDQKQERRAAAHHHAHDEHDHRAHGADHHHHDHYDHGLDVSDLGFQDAHEREHAGDIRRRFADRNVTTGQIVVFGLTGGLVPCPAAITVLLLCLQLRAFTLGVGLVLCFSIGLAAVMVATGAAAAIGVRHVGRRWTGFETFARRAPYFSSALIVCVGLYVGWHGWAALAT
ncbi:MAG: nickel/cobalt efflux transporter [Reyranella sp.]|nr:nickel/cobalt efflux transporter [Reyranella sp.]